MHFFSSNLNFKLEGFVCNDACMQRLVEVRFGQRNKIFKSSGDRPPQLVNDPQNSVTTFNVVSNDSERDEVVNFIHVHALSSHFVVDAVNSFDSVLNIGSESVFFELFLQDVLRFFNEIFYILFLGFYALLKIAVAFRVEMLQCKVLQLASDLRHSETMRNGS